MHLYHGMSTYFMAHKEHVPSASLASAACNTRRTNSHSALQYMVSALHCARNMQCCSLEVRLMSDLRSQSGHIQSSRLRM